MNLEFILDSLFIYVMIIGCAIAAVYFYTRKKRAK